MGLSEFRMMPRQSPPVPGKERWGFIYEYPGGKRIVGWDTFEMAYYAANCLRVPLYEIVGIGVVIPERSDD